MRSAWLEIDLAAYQRNLHALRDYTDTPVLAVVKANAYGHGLVEIARAAIAAGCPGVAVALPEEGAALREAGQPGRILVMGLALPEQTPLYPEYDLEAVVSTPDHLRALAAASSQRPRRVHVKVDTGMTRVGAEPDEAVALCHVADRSPDMELAGVMTHFASADAETLDRTEEQFRRFEPVLEQLKELNPRPLFHACNSAAAIRYPRARLDWVRCGLATYGVYPGRDPVPLRLEPVASLKARIVQVREVPAGRSVTYSGTWTTTRPTRLALVLMGYADGLPWSLANKGAALIRSCRVPIRGRVCMDQTVLDVTDLPEVAVGEEAVFIGTQGPEEITVKEVSVTAGTIPYEIFTRLSPRLPRLFSPKHASSSG